MSPSALRLLRLALVAVLTATCAGPGTAALTWARTVIQLDVPAGAAEAAAVFPFRNTGTVPVRIAMVLSSCDCVTTQPATATYAPGEAGEIRAVFRPEGRAGRMERTISIVTDTNPEVPTVLILRIQVKPVPTPG